MIFNNAPPKGGADGGAGSWSLAQGKWDGEDALGIRWNGESDSDADIGFPKSRNIPIWFIVPDPLKPLILAAVGLAWHILPHHLGARSSRD